MLSDKMLEGRIIKIFYNLVNSFLAGSLVFVGAFTDGNISLDSVYTCLAVSIVIFLTKFREFWDKETKKISNE